MRQKASPDARLRQGLAHYNAGRFALAADCFNEAARGRRRTEALFFASHALRSLGRAAQAERLLRRLLAERPRQAAARGALARLLTEGGRLAEAAAVLGPGEGEEGAAAQRELFAALAARGSYGEAFALGRRMLARGLQWLDLKTFWYPWPPDRFESLRERHGRLLARLGAAAQPWAAYYRATLSADPTPLLSCNGLDDRRYGWMRFKRGYLLLLGLRFEEAASELEAAARQLPADWRALGFLAETLLCLKDEPGARRAMGRARILAPKTEKAEALAWSGALSLWSGRYQRAERELSAAARRGASWGESWLGGALVKRGRLRQALAALDRASAAYPRDWEARVWRAEALRLTGRPREALRALEGVPDSLWAHVNAGLAYASIGNSAGLSIAMSRMPVALAAHLRAEGALSPQALLRSALERARGYRRADLYGNAFWMPVEALRKTRA